MNEQPVCAFEVTQKMQEEIEGTPPILRIAQALERIECLLRQELKPLYIRTCNEVLLARAQKAGIDVVGDDECSAPK